jgi:hypothetical protein
VNNIFIWPVLLIMGFAFSVRDLIDLSLLRFRKNQPTAQPPRGKFANGCSGVSNPIALGDLGNAIRTSVFDR